MLEMLYRCRGTLGMLYRCREAQWMLGVSMDAEELHRCFGSFTDAWGPVDAAGFSGCAGTQRSLTPGGPWLLEALGCRGSVAAGGPPCPHRASHPSPAAGGGRISPRHPVPDAAPGGWCLVVSSSPSPRPARERGQSQHRRAMARGKVLSAWALLASLAVASWGVRGQVYVKEFSGKVFLECVQSKAENKTITWWKDGSSVGHEAQLDLSTVYDDPRGLYVCEIGSERKSLQVHYRMCQNCIEVDAPTISGIVIADVLATLLLAVAVYCISGHDRSHTSRASDRQNLIANELYQPLGEREDEQYSRLAPTRARK